MSIPVLTFFNNKGGVGKTSLVYHVSWMLARLGARVLVCDLDPQANLTAAFLDEANLELLFDDRLGGPADTIYRAIEPLTKVADIANPVLKATAQQNLALLPGDLDLAGFEDFLSSEWPNALGSGPLYRPFRILTAFWQVAQMAATGHHADLIVFDVGPNLGAINRSAILASDFIAVPLGADLFSLQGLSNLGPVLRRWRSDWKKRAENWTSGEYEIPKGTAIPIGYIVQQHSVRLDRPVKAFDKWIRRIPATYAKMVLDLQDGSGAASPSDDGNCLATLKHFRSLISMAQEKRKPIFELTAADGAIGNHAKLVEDARATFEHLARNIAGRIDLPLR